MNRIPEGDETLCTDLWEPISAFDSETVSEPSLVLNQPPVGERLDRFLAGNTELTRSQLARLIGEGNVLVNGETVSKNYLMRAGDVTELYLPEPIPSEALPEPIPLDIVYEDEDVVVINKPTGMVVHPAPGNPSGTLVNALLYHCGATLSGVGGVIRPGIVHRIDKDTSGLLVCAKHDEAHLALSEQLKTHTVSRVYDAIVVGNFREDAFTVNLPIGRNPSDRKKMAIVRNGGRAREAVTHVTVLERFGEFSRVRCELETGRTHQIRVHLSAKGHPILGDPLYGGEGTRFFTLHRALIHGQCLHAGELRFVHPRTGQLMKFTCPLPEDTERLLKCLRSTGDDPFET